MTRPSDLQRITMITDSVFAVSVTLLAHSVRLPVEVIGQAATLHDLTSFLDDLVALVLSFAIASMFWLAQRRDLRKVRIATTRLVILNLAFLLTLVLLPISTRLFSATSLTPLSAAFYSLNLLLASAARLAFRIEANSLADPEAFGSVPRRLPEITPSLYSISVFGASLLAAAFNPHLSELFWSLGFFTPLLERVVERINRA